MRSRENASKMQSDSVGGLEREMRISVLRFYVEPGLFVFDRDADPSSVRKGEAGRPALLVRPQNGALLKEFQPALGFQQTICQSLQLFQRSNRLDRRLNLCVRRSE